VSAVALVVAVLATWRLTHLIVAEDGPWNIVARLRQLAGSGQVGAMMDCFGCTSLWVALPFAFWLAGDWMDGVASWLALSGGAILLERVAPAPLAQEFVSHTDTKP
jgi:hypothetical protein